MILLFLFLLLMGSSFGLTLEQALQIARSNATKARLSLLDIQKAQEQIRQARAGILPNVSFNYSYTHLDKDLALGFTPQNRHSYSLDINQAIFNLSTIRAMDVARENLELQKFVYEDILREIEYQAEVLFYGLLYKKKLIEVYQENLQYWEENYKLVQEKYKAGISPKVELLRSQAQFENAKAQLESAKIDYANALENFKAFLKMEELKDVEGELDYKPYMVQVDFRGLLLNNNTTLKVSKKLVEFQDKKAQQAKAQYYPNVNAFARYQGNTAKIGGSEKMIDGYSLGISLNYNIFDGFARESVIAQSNLDVLKQKEQFLDTQTNLLAQLTTTLNALRSLQAQIDALKVSLEAAKEALKLSKERYRLGIATQLEVLEATNNYNNTILNLYYLYYQHNSNLALLGRLTR